MTDEDIIKIFYKGSHKINSHLTRIEWLNMHQDIYEYLINRYSDSLSICETVYRIKNKIEIRPVCKVCGKPVNFVSGGNGFRETCSISCSKKYIKQTEDIMLYDKVKKHMIKKENSDCWKCYNAGIVQYKI